MIVLIKLLIEWLIYREGKSVKKVLEQEFELFEYDIKAGKTFARYFIKALYKDKYSHNKIDKYQEKFVDRVKKYLHENYPGQYMVASGWCVVVATTEEAKNRIMMQLIEHTVY